MNSKVIKFPKKKRRTPPINLEELKEKFQEIEDTKKQHIEFIINELLPPITDMLVEEGYDLNRSEVQPHLLLFVDSFRSMMYSSCDLEHPLQQLSEKIFIKENNE